MTLRTDGNANQPVGGDADVRRQPAAAAIQERPPAVPALRDQCADIPVCEQKLREGAVELLRRAE
jgi:hypothetical protein